MSAEGQQLIVVPIQVCREQVPNGAGGKWACGAPACWKCTCKGYHPDMFRAEQLGDGLALADHPKFFCRHHADKRGAIYG